MYRYLLPASTDLKRYVTTLIAMSQQVECEEVRLGIYSNCQLVKLMLIYIVRWSALAYLLTFSHLLHVVGPPDD